MSADIHIPDFRDYQTLRDDLQGIKAIVQNTNKLVQDNLKVTEFPDLLTIEQTAKFFGVTKTTIHSWKRKGLLSFIRIPGGAVRFRKSTCEKALKEIKIRGR